MFPNPFNCFKSKAERSSSCDAKEGRTSSALAEQAGALQQSRMRWPRSPPYLQRDPVLDQQPNLDVHEVQVTLQLPAGADPLHHLLLQPQHLRLLPEVVLALLQQVDEAPDDAQRRAPGVDCSKAWCRPERSQGRPSSRPHRGPSDPQHLTKTPHPPPQKSVSLDAGQDGAALCNTSPGSLREQRGSKSSPRAALADAK